MQSRDFAFWLQGFFEITDASSNRAAEGLTEGQVAMIKRHLQLVFQHDTGIAAKPHPVTVNDYKRQFDLRPQSVAGPIGYPNNGAIAIC